VNAHSEHGDSAAPPLRKDAERNRLRILAAAGEVFAERGLEASLDDIAAHADVGVGTVYRRFPNKEALVEALFEQKIAAMIELAEQAAALPDATQALVDLIWTVAQMHARDLGLHQVVAGSTFGRDRVASVRARLSPITTGLVEEALAQGGLRADFDAADLPMIMLMAGSVAQHTRTTDPDMWRRYLRMLLDGIRADGRRTPLPGTPPTLQQEGDISRSWARYRMKENPR